MHVEFFKHNIGPEEKQSVSEVLDTVFLTTGDTVALFEESFAEYVGANACIGLTSCTAALHLSLLALGIGPGDEVITTPMTFVATSLAILHAGATPVWVDVEPETGNLNAELIEDAITECTKVILPVHLYGQMCDMKRIRAIADRHRLFIIEDAAHALEGWRDGICVGELSDAACFSFYATKSITCGEGGAVTTNSPDLAEKIRVLRLHGIDGEAADRYTKTYRHWDLMDIGWKYNMDNIQAALLLPQLRRVDARWKRRREIAFQYRERLSSIPGLRMPAVANATDHAYHLFTVWVDPGSRDEIIVRLQQRGIGVAVNYRSINLLSKFQERFGKGRGSYPESERIGDSTISLPLYSRLTDEEVEYVITSVGDVLSSSDYSHADHIHRCPQALVHV